MPRCRRSKWHQSELATSLFVCNDLDGALGYKWIDGQSYILMRRKPPHMAIRMDHNESIVPPIGPSDTPPQFSHALQLWVCLSPSACSSSPSGRRSDRRVVAEWETKLTNRTGTLPPYEVLQSSWPDHRRLRDPITEPENGYAPVSAGEVQLNSDTV